MKTSRGYVAWSAVSGVACVAITISVASAYVTVAILACAQLSLNGPTAPAPLTLLSVLWFVGRRTGRRPHGSAGSANTASG
jgi:hypothetical protein